MPLSRQYQPRFQLPPINIARATALRDRLANNNENVLDTPRHKVPDTPRGRRPGYSPLAGARRTVMAPVQPNTLGLQPRPPPAPVSASSRNFSARAGSSPRRVRRGYTPRLGSPARRGDLVSMPR